MPVFPPLPWQERTAAWVDHLAFVRAQRKWIKGRLNDLRPASTTGQAAPDDPAHHVHVVVVPQEGYAFDSFRAGTRNFYFEAWRNLAETIGEEHVSVFNVDPGEHPAKWHARLLDYVNDVGATHIITHIESDPGSEGSTWTWDEAWAHLSSHWNGVLLGVMFDSAFEWIAAKARLLARISPRFMVVDICMPMDGSMVRNRPEVGPVNMPLSRESLALVDDRLAGITPQWDVSFIGVVYPYRMTLVERLRSLGVRVAVNPHRHDVAEDDKSSRLLQPTWLDYMAGLRSSRMTLNFSQSSAGRFEQLKTRVIEATLAGTLLLTDDLDRTRLFWTPDEEYVYFRTVDELPYVITALMNDPLRIAEVAQAGQVRARSIVHDGFWGGIESGLARRGLPSVVLDQGSRGTWS